MMMMALAVARAFARGAQILHVVDLDGAFSGGESPNRDVLQRIVEQVNVPVEFGGGLRTSPLRKRQSH